MELKTWKIYFILVFLTALITYSIQYLFIENNLYYQTFGEQMTLSQIDKMLMISKKYQWLGFAFIPVLIISRAFYTSTFLYIGVFFFELKMEYGKIFKIALLAEFIYILSIFTKLFILIFFKEIHTLEDLQFQPFSVMQLLNKSRVNPLFFYPLSLLNVFELSYFLLLGWLLAPLFNESDAEGPLKFGKSLRLVIVSYGSGLLLWILTAMFITLNMS